MSLEKLNQIAKMVEEAIASHPDSSKKPSPLEGSPEEEKTESPSDEAAEDGPARAQKSMRKNFGGQKEPK
jgi:hypothetical protein